MCCCVSLCCAVYRFLSASLPKPGNGSSASAPSGTSTSAPGCAPSSTRPSKNRRPQMARGRERKPGACSQADISDRERGQLATPLDGPGGRISGVERRKTRSSSNCSVRPWKNSRSASSPQRSSHIASVLSLSHQRIGWTPPRTDPPRVLASRKTPLRR